MTIFGNFGLLLSTLGYFWLLWTIFGYFLLLLFTFGFRLGCQLLVFGWLLGDGGGGPHGGIEGTVLPSQFTFPRLALKQKKFRLGRAKINNYVIRSCDMGGR